MTKPFQASCQLLFRDAPNSFRVYEGYSLTPRFETTLGMNFATCRMMRYLGIGESFELGDLYLRLQKSGHEVRVRASDPDATDVFAGLVPRSDRTLEEDLDWVGKQANFGIILFEGTGQGRMQSLLRGEGYAVIGGSLAGDKLEEDRAYGQQILRDFGLLTAPMHEVIGFDAAIEHVANTKRPYVLKFSGLGFSSTRTYVGMLDDGSDMVAVLQQQKQQWSLPQLPRLILMQRLQGVEVGVGAWFNGNDWVLPANLDWEHKRFFPGDLGENTGEMGTVVSYQHAEKLFEATLVRTTQFFRDAKHVGYVNLNMIVNSEGAWPLEFTCRFGYPGFAILSALAAEEWHATLQRLICKTTLHMPTHEGFAVGIVLTVPPFPYPYGYDRLSNGMPICFAPTLSNDERMSLHFGEVGMKDGQLITAGQVGYCMVATGRGLTIAEAQRAAYGVAKKVAVPNVRYRNDIGDALLHRDHKTLQTLGWLPWFAMPPA